MNIPTSDARSPRPVVPPRHIHLIHLLAAAIAVMAVASARGADTWTGGGASGNWSDNNNWGGSATSYGTLTFTGNTRTTNADDSITAMNSLFWNGSSPWTLNQGGSTVLSLYDNSGAQAKIENQSTGLVTINLPITFAANNGSPPTPFGEINAVSGNMTFGTGTLTVNGASVNGIKFFGTGNTVTFNNTVSASGKWFGMTANNDNIVINGSATTGDFYVMDGGTLSIGAGGSLSTSALRLGGDFSTTGNQNQALGGTFALTSVTGGQTFSSTINTVSGNTSNALFIQSLNTSGTNTVSGPVFQDAALTVQNSAGGTLLFSGTDIDVKQQQLTISGSGTTIVNEQVTTDFTTGGSLVKSGPGTLILAGTNNDYTGTTNAALNANGTQIGGGTLGIYAATSLGLAPAGAYNNIQFIGSGTLQDTNSNITLGSVRNISIANGVTATFDSGGNSFAVQGVINGTGGAVAKVGAGTLTLAGANTYTGATSVLAGAMVVSGSLAGTSAASVSAGASLEVDGLLNLSATTTVNGTLQGNGSTGGIAANGGTIAPGLTVANSLTANGALTAGGAVSLSSTTNFAIRLGTALGTGNDQLAVTGGSISLNGANLQLTLGTFLNDPANVGNLYVIINGGASGTGTGGNTFAQGTSFTVGGYAFNIDYASNATGNGSGSDVVLKLTAIPEPGTWTGLGFGGIFLTAFCRRRRE